MNSCESCGSKEDLIESGGQFCGGTWYLCTRCDDEAKKFAEFCNTKFRQQLERKKDGSKD